MKKHFIIILFFLFISFNAKSETITEEINYSYNTISFSDTSKIVINEKGDTIILKKRKFTAILLALLTGPVGGHRLYLGTKPIVPIVYAVTLGGGFLVIPIMDIITIIFTKDLSKYENNDQVIMWINGENSEDFYEYEDSE